MKMDMNSKLNLTSLNAEPKNISSKSNNISFNNDKNCSTKSREEKDFKSVLNETTNNNEKVNTLDNSKYEDKNIDENVDVNDTDSSIEEKLNEIEEKIENSSKDELVEILNSIFNMLSSVKNEDVDLKNVNSNVLDLIMNSLEKEGSGSDLSRLLENLMNVSENSLKDVLSSDNKELLKNLLSKLENKLDEGTELSNKVKDLMNQISNSLENKESKTSNFNNAFKNFNQNTNSETAKQNAVEEKVVTTSTSTETDEDDFLNKLLKGNKEDNVLNKINLVASRNEINSNNVQNNGQTMVINKATMGEDLIKSVKFMMTNAMKELTVKINPKDLGQLTISLIQENGIMKASIKANSKETFELLSQNLVQMKKAITEQNIKVADVNVELYQEDTTFYKDESFGRGLNKENHKQSGNNGQTSEVDLIESEEEVTEILNSNLDFFA